MKISVIIPLFNRVELISRAIESVLSQKRKADEIIVVDDGSKDSPELVLQKYQKDIVFLKQNNYGVSHARNRGVEKCTGDYIAFLDSDDQWLSNKLFDQEKFFIDNPDYEIMQCEEIWNRNGKRVNPMKKHKKMGGWIFDHCLEMCRVSPSAVMLKKSLYNEYGGFDENMEVCEDYDLWLKISLHHPIGLVTVPGIIKYGGHEDQLSRKYWGMDRFRVFSLNKLLENPEIGIETRKKIIYEIIRKIDILIKGYQNNGRNIDLFLNVIDKYQTGEIFNSGSFKELEILEFL